MQHTRLARSQTIPRTALVLALACALTAATAPKPRPTSPRPDDATITHVLNRIAFGPASGDVERVRLQGLDRYIEAQLRPEAIPDTGIDSRLGGLETLSLSSREIATSYVEPLIEMRRTLRREPSSGSGADAPPSSDGPLAKLSPEDRRRAMELRRGAQLVVSELGQQKLIRAVYSQRQLQEGLVDFWFNHFNVFAGKGPVQTYLTEYERDAIRPHVLGHFRELLGAVAHSPAMLFYLDNWQSSDPEMASRGRPMAKPSPRAPRGLNENYARELLELHTMGVDGGYTQQDIGEVAKAFTGWTIRGPRQGGGFWFDERRHAPGRKKVLGHTIDKGGEEDGEAVLDLLAEHRSTATFIATKLTRRFVVDEPPQAVVQRAAATFRETKGDLREVVRAILTSPEFLSTEARRAKVKTPFEFVASALRASNADVTSAAALVRNLRELGMPLYYAQPPTGYADRADAWVNTGSLLARMNFALALVTERIPGVRVDLATLGGDRVDAARARFLDTVLSGEASAETRQTLGKGTDVGQLAALAFGSPEFQRR
jgi:uncharacterized protein (DUF1800 family)